MYSEQDLETAVAAGALTPEAAAALRHHAEGLRASPAVDEEQFRLITSFNDIFVTIAAIMLLVAVGWLGSTFTNFVAAFAVAAVAWGLAEFFTRQRRMALPSIVLLIAFVYGVLFGAMFLLLGTAATSFGEENFSTAGEMIKGVLAAAVAVGAAVLHWRRFHVPITVAAGTGAMMLVAIGLVLAVVPALREHTLILVFLAGIATFIFAMLWDKSDRTRTTRRSDVAFWLHLSAAPLLVHPVFSSLGLIGSGTPPIWTAGVALLLYVALAFVALAIDRRALLVSALIYVLFAMYQLFEQLGNLNISFALTALVVGSALLLLSALWHGLRARLVRSLPIAWQERLPVTGRV